MWFREYVINILIQPVHLLLYMILVGGAMDLVEVNIIYAIVAIGFLIPAEKLIRKFFGFDNAGTLSAAGSFAGGAVFSAMINKLNKPKSGGASGDKDVQKPVRKTNSGGAGVVDAHGTLVGSGSSGSSGGEGGSPTPPGGGGGSPTPPGGGGGSLTPPGGGGGSPTPPGGGGGSPTPPGGGGGSLTPPGGGSGTPLGNISIPAGLRDSKIGGRAGGDWSIRASNLIDRAGTKFGTRIANTGRAVGYRAANKARNAIRNAPKTAGRWTRKAVVGGIAGGGLALAGAAVGIASGDPSKAAQLAMAGGAAGYYGANYYGDKVAKATGGLGESARTSFWGSDMRDIDSSRFDRQFVEDPKNREALTKAFGSRAEVVEKIKDGSVQALLNNGIYDPNKMGKALKLQKKYAEQIRKNNPGLSKQKIEDQALTQAVAMAKWNRDVSTRIYDPMSRDRMAFEKRLQEQLENEGGMDKASAKSRVEEILNDLETFEM